MTDLFGIVITLSILAFLGLLIWARVQDQTLIEILTDIRDFMKGEQ